LKEDPTFVGKVVGVNGELLEYVSSVLRADREIVRVAVNNSVKAFKYACKSIKNDYEFVLEQVRVNPSLLE